MDGQPPPLPWPPPTDRPPPPGQRRCLAIGSVGCVTLAVLAALLVGALILLVKFVWGLHLDQWL